MVSHHPAKFGGNRHCSSGGMMFVVVEGQVSTYPRLDPPLLFISKAWYAMLTHTKLQNVDTIICRCVQ